MSLGLLGKKVGMTHIYDEDGVAVSVTVVDVSENQILQVKNSASDGYSGVQVGVGAQKERRVNRPEMGHFKKWGGSAKMRVKEFRFASDEGLPEAGSQLSASLFEKGQYVDVIGTTKGKGFQGVVKRFAFGGLPMTHGSMMHRRTGGISAGTDPARVWPGTRMPGHDGSRQRTVQNLKIMEVRDDDKVVLIRGAIPGSKGGYVIIRPSKKKPLPAQQDQEVQEG